MANPRIDNFEVTDTLPLWVTGPSDLRVASDALVSSIGFKQVRDASTPAARTLLLVMLPSLGKKTVRMGVMAKMLAV